MKLERLHEYVLPAVVIGAGMLLAMFVGSLTGGGNMTRLFHIFLGIALIFLLVACNRRVWMLIPACWYLIGKVSLIPLPFSVRNLAVLIVFGMVLILVAFKYFRQKPEYGWLDVILALNLFYLATCFMRNPVGLEAFRSEIVGGRPYFEVFIGMMAYWVLIRMRATPGEARALPLFCLVGPATVALFGIIIAIFPPALPIIASFYAGMESTGGYVASGQVAVSDEGPKRLSDFRDLGKLGSVAICSYFPPMTLIAPGYPWRMLAFLSVATAILLSGFRGFVIYAAIMFLLGSYFRKGVRGAITLVAVGVILLGIVAAGQGLVYELPLTVQRALSFLPGRWSTLAKDSGSGSTQWRVEMWKIVLSSDEFIRNKFLGDGFGFTRRELQFIQQSRFGVQTDSMTREYAMIAGDYHSGPISTLKFVGVPGIILFYILMIYMAKMAVRQILRARNTPFFALALFVGMPVVFEPLFYTIIFGGYNGALPNALFNAGMLRLIQHSLDDHIGKDVKPELVVAPVQGKRLGGQGRLAIPVRIG